MNRPELLPAQGELHGLHEVHQKGHWSRPTVRPAQASTDVISLIVSGFNAFITTPASFWGFLFLKLLEMGKEISVPHVQTNYKWSLRKQLKEQPKHYKRFRIPLPQSAYFTCLIIPENLRWASFRQWGNFERSERSAYSMPAVWSGVPASPHTPIFDSCSTFLINKTE